MTLKSSFVFVLSFLLLFTPVAPVSASSPVGRMFTKGTAEINGVTVPPTTSVFPKDRIATEKETTTSLSLSDGDAVVISEMTKATVDQRDGEIVIKLEAGTLSTLNKGSKLIAIEAIGARIKSASNFPAVYDVIVQGNSLRVVARGGVTRVETANKTTDLQPGTELDATLAPPDPSPAPAAPPLHAGLSHATTWILVTSVAAGVTGLALGVIAIQKVNNCHLSPNKIDIIC